MTDKTTPAEPADPKISEIAGLIEDVAINHANGHSVVDWRSVLSRVHQHPHLLSRLAHENTGERTAALCAGVVLLDSRILHRAGADQRQRVVRINRRRLSVEVRTRGTGLDPEFHLQ